MRKSTGLICRALVITTFVAIVTCAGGAQQPILDGSSSAPTQHALNVSMRKGVTGLSFRFSCYGGTSGCLPLVGASQSPAPCVTLRIGQQAQPGVIVSSPCGTINLQTQPGCSASNPRTLTCAPLGSVPETPGSCQYSFVEPNTVKILYFGTFDAGNTVQYSVQHVEGGNLTFQGPGPNTLSFCTGFSNTGPVSLELVFDVSGSMGWPAVASGTGVTRMAVLKNAAQTFFDTLNSYALPGDKLGSVFFSTIADPDGRTITCQKVDGSPLSPATTANVMAVQNKVAGLQPTLRTSIGKGLQSAKACGFDKDIGSTNVREIILFSDGVQNELPNVTAPNGQVLLDGLQYDSSTPPIRICPVTLGRQVPPGFTLQQSIADAACNGQNVHIRDTDPATSSNPETISVADLQTFFAQSLAAVLPTDKLEIVADTTGAVSNGNALIGSFLVAENDLKMTIALSAFGGQQGEFSLPFKLIAPGETAIDLSNRVTFTGNTSFTTIAFPLFQNGLPVPQNGEWRLEFNGANVGSASIPYHLLVMADNPTIASDFTIDAHDVGTGEPIPIRVRLTDNGAPILNAKVVEARLMGPAKSQGNMLATTPTPDLARVSDPASTKGQAKLDALYHNPKNASLFADTTLPDVLTLRDNGNMDNGDKTANDGVYSALFKGTDKEGHYYFKVTVTAANFQRAYLISRFVRSKPDPEKTILNLVSSTSQPNGTVLVKLEATPHDALANYLGPGYEKDMQIKSSEGTVENVLDDKLNGSYEITYRLPSAFSNPSFTIQIMGATVTTKTLEQLQGHTTSAGKFAVFADLGAGIPNGVFSNAFNTGVSFNGGLEYIVNPHFSAEGILGFHRFGGKFTGDLNVVQFSGNAKVYLTSSGPWRPFVNGGVGGYHFNLGSTTEFGGNFGGGLLREINSHWGVQASYNFHAVNTSGGATKFSTVQGGIRWVF